MAVIDVIATQVPFVSRDLRITETWLKVLKSTVVLTSELSGVLAPASGGTGVANNAAATLTRSGNHALTLTTSGTTNVTLPTSGTLATTAQLIGGSWASPGAAIGTGTPVAITGTNLTATGIALVGTTTSFYSPSVVGGYLEVAYVGSTENFNSWVRVSAPNGANSAYLNLVGSRSPLGNNFAAIRVSNMVSGVETENVGINFKVESAGAANSAIAFETHDGSSRTERLRITGTGLVTFAGTTSSFPALKRSTTNLQVRLADDSAYAPIDASAYKVGGAAGVDFGPGAVTSITVVKGIITAIS